MSERLSGLRSKESLSRNTIKNSVSERKDQEQGRGGMVYRQPHVKRVKNVSFSSQTSGSKHIVGLLEINITGPPPLTFVVQV